MKIIHLKTIDSTNIEAKNQIIYGETAPFWIIADYQTNGRGRLGRVWQSFEGNLFSSGVYAFNRDARLTVLSPIVALAIANVLSKFIDIENIKFKWPNDILVNQKKISGILIETFAHKNQLIAIIGIGLNILDSPQNLEYKTTTLESECNDNFPNKMIVLDYIINEINYQFDIFNKNGFEEIRNELLKIAPQIGEEVKINDGKNIKHYAFIGIDDIGALIVEDEIGVTHNIYSGELQL